jgi:hypothetical protein
MLERERCRRRFGKPSGRKNHGADLVSPRKLDDFALGFEREHDGVKATLAKLRVIGIATEEVSVPERTAYEVCIERGRDNGEMNMARGESDPGCGGLA